MCKTVGVGRIRGVKADAVPDDAAANRPAPSSVGASPAGGDAPLLDSWASTLNWDYVPSVADDFDKPLLLVGSQPKTYTDVSRLHQEGGVQAIVCVQSEEDFFTFGTRFNEVRDACAEHAIVHSHVPALDLDVVDQAAILPCIARTIALHYACGRRTYVHCSAGVNRSPLAVLAFMTFYFGMSLDTALEELRSCRPQVRPYLSAWHQARTSLLCGRDEFRQRFGRAQNLEEWEHAGNHMIASTIHREVNAMLSLIQSERACLR